VAAGFETTDWTLVRTATGRDQNSRAALARLCDSYWYPLYAFVRHLGYAPEDAADLVQGFFAVLLEKHYLEDVNPRAGRFRTFLLSSLKHFLANERAKERALKRGGGLQVVSLDSEAAERRWAYEPVGGKTPEDVFERRWARTVMEHALARLRSERTAVGKGVEFDLLTPYLTGEEPHPAYSEVAERLGTSMGAVRVAVHRLRNQFGDLMRHEIRRTVSDPRQVDGEIRHLLEVLGVSEHRS
jgi:RNA polymerase sigma-70 factor (ECF subfamily)